MNFDRRWLWLSPLFALVLVFGPDGDEAKVRPQSDGSDRTSAGDRLHELDRGPVLGPSPSDAPSAETGEAAKTKTARSSAPDLSEILVALGAVLAVGTAGLYLLRKAKALPSGGDDGAVRLRQSLRVGARHTVHAIEFDGRVLLVGESEKGLTVLDRTRDEDEELDRGVDLLDTPVRSRREPAVEPVVTVPRPGRVAPSAPGATTQRPARPPVAGRPSTRPSAKGGASQNPDGDVVDARTKFEPLLRHLQRAERSE